MAACTKVAAFGALLRVFYVGLGGMAWQWQPILWTVAILTMVVGSVVALTQTDVKRLLAYSSIAHAGFILTGLVATDTIDAKTGEVLGVSSVLFYLLAYGFITIGAFAVVTLVRDAGGEATHLSQWAGLARRSPLVAWTFTLFLAAFAGIPLTSGFTGEVRRVLRGDRRRRGPARRRRRRDERDRGLLLLPGGRADVLLRPRRLTGPPSPYPAR